MISNEVRLQERRKSADVTIAKLQSKIAIVLSQFPVEFAYLHGSVAQGHPLPDSDVDIAVMLTDSVASRERLSVQSELAYAIASACGWDFEKVDVRTINQAPLAVRGKIVQKGMLLYEKDKSKRVAFEVLTRSMYFDFAPVAEKMRTAFLRRVRDKGLISV